MRPVRASWLWMPESRQWTGINLLATPDFLIQLEPRDLLALSRLEHVFLFSVMTFP